MTIGCQEDGFRSTSEDGLTPVRMLEIVELGRGSLTHLE